MNHKWIARGLSVALLIGSCPAAQAMRAYEYTGGYDPATGKSFAIELRVTDNDCNTTTVPVFDASGNPLWVETYTSEDGLHWVPVEAAVSESQLKNMLNARISGLEKKYHIRIKNGYNEDLAHQLERMDQLEELIKVIPFPLWQSAQAQLTRIGKKLTIYMSTERNSGNAGTYDPKTTTIHMLNMSPNTFAHEYGHFLQITILEPMLGANKLQNEWVSLNSGHGYNESPVDLTTFVTDYAATHYREDFAESFAYLLTKQSHLIDQYAQNPDCGTLKKMSYIKQLLSQTFSLDANIFPTLVPSQPSPWAEATIKEYQTNFPFSPLASNTVPFYAGYQNNVTRFDFAKGIYDLCSQLLRDHNKTWEEVSPGSNNSQNPFLDSQPGDILHYEPIAKLYQAGLIKGVSANRFNPEGKLSRQEAAVMIYNVCKFFKYEFPENQELEFADAETCADWAAKQIAAVSAAKIMNGYSDGRFGPTDHYTYEQSAATLQRVYEMLK